MNEKKVPIFILGITDLTMLYKKTNFSSKLCNLFNYELTRKSLH